MSYDSIIFTEINQILNRAQLNTEMLNIIKSSLQVDYGTGELYRWAHLTLISCECINGISEAALPGAIGMELFALAADIFDDIQDQDNDDLPWRRLSDANALNLALCLLMLSFEAVSVIPDNRLFREIGAIFHQTGIKACNGQYQDCLYDNWKHVTLEQYFEMIKQKSASLTACACKIGAILGDAPAEVVSQFEQFGMNFGVMSQISNDLNDFLDFTRKKDFVNNKKTLPYVYLINILQGETAERFKELTRIKDIGSHNLGNVEWEFLKKIAIDEGVVQYCKVMYEIFRQKALDIILAVSVPEEYKEKMIKLVGESV